MVQLLSLTVELGWNLKATQKISPTLYRPYRKIPFTTLVRALGFSGDDEIFDIFGDSELVRNTVEKRYPQESNGLSYRRSLERNLRTPSSR